MEKGRWKMEIPNLRQSTKYGVQMSATKNQRRYQEGFLI